MISILMINLNCERYIATAISSVLEQEGCELVIVDPGSTDSSRNIIDSFCAANESRIKKVYVSDSGPSEGLNNALKEASGSVIGVLNSDDLYLPGSIKFVNDFFHENNNVDVLLCSGIICDERSHEIRMQFPFYTSKQSLVLGVNNFFHQGLFYRRDRFPEVSFNQSNRISWDREMLAQLILLGAKVKISDMPVAIFRITNSSISGTREYRSLIASTNRRILLETLNLAHISKFRELYFFLYSGIFRVLKYLRGIFKSALLGFRRTKI